MLIASLVVGLACTVTAVALVRDCGGGDTESALTLLFWLAGIGFTFVALLAARQASERRVLSVLALGFALASPSAAFGIWCAA